MAKNALASSDWGELLRQSGMADDEGARAALQELAHAISKLQSSDIQPGSREKLLNDIELLKSIIGAALRESPPLTFVRQCVNTAYNFGVYAAIGAAAAASGAEASGSDLKIDVISAGITSLTTWSLTRIYRQAAKELKSQRLPSQLKKSYDDLVLAIQQCEIFLCSLTGPSSPAEDEILDPPRDDEIEAARGVFLSSDFLLTHVQQLAIALPGLERKGFTKALGALKMVLQATLADIVNTNFESLRERVSSLQKAKEALKTFSESIGSLR